MNSQKIKIFKPLTMIGLLISTLLISTNTLADHHRSKGMLGGGEKMIQRMIHFLEMDKTQKEKIWAIYDDIHPQLRSLGEQSNENHKTLRKAIHSDASKQYIDRLARKQGNLKAEMISLRADMQQRIHSHLTDEQRVKVKEKMTEKRERRKQYSKRYRGQKRVDKQ